MPRVWTGLVVLWPSYLAYVVTFMLIGQIWANHHVLFDQVRSADRVVLFLNTVLLMDVAFLPFAASVLAQALRDGQGQRTAVVLHGLTFELAAILLNLIWWYASRGRRLLVETIEFGRREGHRRAISTRPRVDRDRNRSGRAVPTCRSRRDRGLHSLLLVADRGRGASAEGPPSR
jgi:hypothetical protein